MASNGRVRLGHWFWILLPAIAACGGSEFSSGVGSLDASADDDAGGMLDGGLPLQELEASVIGGISILPPRGLITSEDGDQASFEVVLVNEPTASVTIAFSSNDESEGTVGRSQVTFDVEDWNRPQAIVISGQDDEDVDGDRSYVIVTEPATSDDPRYDGADPADVEVTNLDNDAVGIRFAPKEGLVTSETGDQANFTARLTSKPTGDVALFLESSDPSEGQVSPRVLTFTTENWSSPKMVTVTGQNDDEADGSKDYEIIIENIISADPNYQSLNLESERVALRNTDDDSAGITVTAENLVTTESGGTSTFTVVLNREPADDVVIRVASSDVSEGTVSPSLLVFTVDNWSAPQEVTVTGVDDDETDGDQEYSIELDRALSVDAAYNGIDVPDITVTNIDNESAGFSVTPQSITVSEKGTSAEFQLRPNTQPSFDVVVGLSVTDESEGRVDPSQLTFTTENWETPQFVEVTGIDDDETDGNQEFFVQTAPAQSEDDGYRGLNPQDVTVTNLDDDTSGVSVNPVMGLETNEGGTTAEFIVTLLTEPSSPVRVTLSSSDETEGAVSPSAIDFDLDNWSDRVSVTVMGVDDPITDGAQPFTIVTEVETDDENYADVVVADVLVTNRDDECPTPPMIDDFEDANLTICPNQGRSGTWTAENTVAGSLEMRVQDAERDGSMNELALVAIGRPMNDVTLPVEDTQIDAFPMLASAFSANADGGPEPYDASLYSGFRLYARATGGKLRISVVTTDSAGAVPNMGCFGGCVGHYDIEFDVTENWTVLDVPFTSLNGSVRGGEFRRDQLLGLKFALEVTNDYELWLDNIEFIP